ncbi:type II toxin-antitoxin system Phd/YefM family antitoxin [Ottowia sp.]|uniref:type II toxin-antitoxin system Phd/YefM family antitoxin n=1 Tax=Ottowia sp. TaxID=1898956 RepID=UPI002BD8E497|nr:type II toxin-antitoxin system Phd/YefM family antitoxin [Ottowia sp.]HOB66785.1 type II toxin-antitoxin system Phd/YefM family antitoxin [Ottowia sp.]HPZ57349.1 type II toxin-antitoxin system Phd/YefM family antitoxin [Ottowia sp.]HQD48112.1 type II toxin-antitoxin system Phd/YefM family antitoxin [Ottowia sp.]
MGLTLSSTWQVNEAKSRFSELLERAQREGPQTITRHGKPVARVVPLDPAGAIGRPALSASGAHPGQASFHAGLSFTEFLLNAPKIEGGLPEMPRDSGMGRRPLLGEE